MGRDGEGRPVVMAQTAAPFDSDDEDDGVRWYRRRRVWGIGFILVVIAIVVPVAVTVVRNDRWRNRYPDYTNLTYRLTETYSGENFFDKFDYFEGYDPSHGFVHYVPRERAQGELNLTYANANSAFLRVDATVGPTSVPDASTGRFSARVESKSTYNAGLFVFDVRHTPVGCATWPALWLTDRNSSIWPTHGEIDVMEAVNQGTDGNQMTLHTSPGCTMRDVRRQNTGRVNTQGDCVDTPSDHTGCAVNGPAATFGDEFNRGGGGVVAMEWRREGIRMWQWGRGGVPSDVLALTPDPSVWGTAMADFPSTECDIERHFRNQSLILNVNVCGDWVYAVYANSGCPSNCTDFAANNPDAFHNAYWEFGAFHVYQSV